MIFQFFRRDLWRGWTVNCVCSITKFSWLNIAVTSLFCKPCPPIIRGVTCNHLENVDLEKEHWKLSNNVKYFDLTSVVGAWGQIDIKVRLIRVCFSSCVCATVFLCTYKLLPDGENTIYFCMQFFTKPVLHFRQKNGKGSAPTVDTTQCDGMNFSGIFFAKFHHATFDCCFFYQWHLVLQSLLIQVQPLQKYSPDIP